MSYRQKGIMNKQWKCFNGMNTTYRNWMIRQHPFTYVKWLVGRPMFWFRKRTTGKAPF